MPGSTVSAQFEATPDEAWAVVGDFDGIGEMFDGIEDVVIDGSNRTFTMAGMRITERLVARDDDARSLTYAITDGVPVESHEATITVSAHDAGCEISWTVSTVPEEAEPLFIDTYQRGLDHLHDRLDAR